jgi:hypothetical protein
LNVRTESWREIFSYLFDIARFFLAESFQNVLFVIHSVPLAIKAAMRLTVASSLVSYTGRKVCVDFLKV